jgi:spoIIIJ-associated protein
MTEENQLEKEGEIAADFIEEFLDLADLDGDLEIELRQENPTSARSLIQR